MSNFNEADVNRDKDGKFANKPGAGAPPEVDYISVATEGIPSTTVADPKAQAAKAARRTQQAYRQGRSPFADYMSAASGGIVSSTIPPSGEVDTASPQIDDTGFLPPDAENLKPPF